jgi:hypothetical protein
VTAVNSHYNHYHNARLLNIQSCPMVLSLSTQANSIAGEEPVITQTQILPPDIVGDGSIKLFNKWSFEDVEVKDISLTYSSIQFNC